MIYIIYQLKKLSFFKNWLKSEKSQGEKSNTISLWLIKYINDIRLLYTKYQWI